MLILTANDRYHERFVLALAVQGKSVTVLVWYKANDRISKIEIKSVVGQQEIDLQAAMK
jgi:hypothetical protein